MAEAQHKAIGRLRGRAAPRDDTLDRLLRVHPDYRVSWAPPSGERPGLWEIHQYRESPLRRSAGLARLRRFERWSKERQEGNPGIARQAQDMIDGFHFVAAFEEERFGTDRMFFELGDGEIEVKKLYKRFMEEQVRAEALEIGAEIEENPEFAEDHRGAFAEAYDHLVFGTGWTPALERAKTGFTEPAPAPAGAQSDKGATDG